MLAGILIIVIGIVFLLQSLGIISQSAWTVIWPIILIIIGAYIVIRRSTNPIKK